MTPMPVPAPPPLAPTPDATGPVPLPAEAEAAWLANGVERLGLGSVARLLLECVRPFGPLGAQMVWLAQPTLALFGAGSAADRLARTLEDDTHLDALIGRLGAAPVEDRR